MSQPYIVLATKYRPQNFDDLIGQDVLIRTLSNAIKANRIANAFLLTGIRGIGKTTTARIIAKALNCIGVDGKGGATSSPCGECVNCKSITEDRHPDILEIDAASRTGVDDIREIIDNANYAPTSARYKIYIIDEVHMLSKNAFNALLKTLEEPPKHVKFIFATTETRKIPITIVSRCQRFDLRRIDQAMLTKHLMNITKKENIEAEEEALNLIASAAEGSVRDSLSMLDQAISHADNIIDVNTVSNMLGLADNSKIKELFEEISGSNIAKALDIFKELYDMGADPVLVINDLLEYNYLLTKLKVANNSNIESSINMPQEKIDEAKKLAESLSISYLTRSWQMLLKGLGETKMASHPFIAAEMLLVRLGYMSELPSPASLAKDLKNSPQDNSPTPTGSTGHPVNTSSPARSGGSISTSSIAAATELSNEQALDTQTETSYIPNNFKELAELFKLNNEQLLYNWLLSEVNLVKFELGKLEIRVSKLLQADFASRITACLNQWTGIKWIVAISNEEGEITLAKQEKLVAEKKLQEVKDKPEIAKILKFFPDAKVKIIEEK